MFANRQVRPWPVITAVSVAVAIVAVVVSIRSAGADDGPSWSSRAETLEGRDIAVAFDPRGAASSYLPAPGGNPVLANGKGDIAGYPGGATRSSLLPQGCSAVLPLKVSPLLDLPSVGITPGSLGSAFDLLTVGVRSEAECNDGRVVDRGTPVLDTSWIHRESQVRLMVTQKPQAVRSANVVSNGFATIWSNGQLYTISAGWYGPYPVPVSGGRGDGTPGATPGSTPAQAPAIAPGEPYPGGLDPRVAEVIRLAIADLAPSIPRECLAQEVVGDWPALANFGFGDPRPALPSGYTQSHLDLRYTAAASASCGEPPLAFPFNGVQLSANFSSGRDGNVGFNIYPFSPNADAYPGSLNDYGANWVNKSHQVAIYGNKANGGLGIDALRKLAKALDPAFNEACLMVERKIGEGDLAGLGLGKAVAPSGYKVEDSEGQAAGVSPACTDAKLKQFSNLNFHWTFRKEDFVIEANISRNTPGDASGRQGSIGEGYINWSDGKGTWYSVNGNSRRDGTRPAQDDLVAIAKSMDPGLDVSTLQKGGDGPVKPMPMPADSSESAKPR